LREIEICLEHGLYQTAIGMSLSIPDMCGALESADGRATGEKYKTWFLNNIDKEIGISAEDCYYFRCSFLHQRSTMHGKSNYDRIVFNHPNCSVIVHGCNVNNVLNIDLGIFCSAIIDAAKKWLLNVKSDPNFINNYKNSFRKNPEGVLRAIGNVDFYG